MITDHGAAPLSSHAYRPEAQDPPSSHSYAPAPRCITPPPSVIDRKMQLHWRPEMLEERKRQDVQKRTDALLGMSPSRGDTKDGAPAPPSHGLDTTVSPGPNITVGPILGVGAASLRPRATLPGEAGRKDVLAHTNLSGADTPVGPEWYADAASLHPHTGREDGTAHSSSLPGADTTVEPEWYAGAASLHPHTGRKDEIAHSSSLSGADTTVEPEWCAGAASLRPQAALGAGTTGPAATANVRHPHFPETTPPCRAPVVSGLTGPRLQQALDRVLAWQSPATQTPEFSFRWTKVAAAKNLELLQSYDMDLGRALDAQPFSTLTIGSEFRPPDVLEEVCGNHPLWSRVRRWLTTGVEHPLRPIPEDERLEDVKENLARGNHLSARRNEAQLLSMLQKEVQKGWQLILPREAALLIRNAILGPLGLVEQDSINELGEIISKYRLTHDQSYNVVPGTRRSVNDRVRFDSLTPCRYGCALMRLAHYVLGLRRRHPRSRILLTKVDLKSAYRRMHYCAATAVQAMITIGAFVLIALRMTFGGAPNPSQWSDLSELACDLINDLVRDDGWDEQTYQSPHQHLIGDGVELEADDVAFGSAGELLVDVPADDQPKADVFIDDLFMAFLETDAARGSRVIPFVVHLLSRPVSDSETIERDDLLSFEKFLAEATPAEQKTILGWVIDTRRLTIALPANKHAAWSRSIDDILTADKVTYKELEVLIGRLNHAAFVIPMARHFLGRLRTALYAANHRRSVRLNQAQRDDLHLWKAFLQSSAMGISLNLIALLLPSRISRSDACEHGIGGFSATCGIAWRWEIPPELRHRLTLNGLEFLACYITIAVDMELGAAPRHSCFLSQSDSTSAAGWLRKSNFADETPVHQAIARETARVVLQHDSTLASQWIPGDENDVSDCLSRDHHLDDSQLLALLYSAVPEQIPEGFRICPLPPAIVSRVTTWMHSLPASTQSPTAPVRSKLATGATSSGILRTSSSTPTHSLPDSPATNGTASSGPSPLPSARTPSSPTLVHQQLLHRYREQSAPPSTLWHRPTGLTTWPAHSTMSTADSRSFYSAN